MTTTDAPIAIIGMAATFAQAGNLEQFWSNILQEVDCITDVPAGHWSVDDYYDADPAAADKTYCRRGGFLPDIAFDPLEFGLPPNILEVTDVSQLLSLVIAKQALADAGYGAANPLAATTGVALGVSSLNQTTPLASRLQYPIWQRVLDSSGVAPADRDRVIERMKQAYIAWQEDAFPGYLSNVVAGRITNRLDLGGINCTVDAACASSMASLRMAVHELRSGNSDMMIAGGVDTNNSIMAYLSFSKTPAFTAHGHMRPFDRDSDGLLIGEGIGMLVLRRLEDAERDGNRIYAVIKGIGASSDGRHKSIYAPRVDGQEAALRRALEAAGCAPSCLGLIEAHGTGTATGDPTELVALQRVFGGGQAPEGGIALGSVKSQIGHTKVAAGAASLIKVALALHHKVLPPTINVLAPHPRLAEPGSPFYLNTGTRPWFSTDVRRAGVSSFGFGGTNFHVVMEEHPGGPAAPLRQHHTPWAIALHAADAERLDNLCRQTAAALVADASGAAFRALVEMSRAGRFPADAARVGFIAGSREEAAARLQEAAAAIGTNPGAETLALPGGIFYRRRGLATEGRVVALFSGQGSQYVGMGTGLCLAFPAVRQAFEEMDAVLLARGERAVSGVVFPPPVFGDDARAAQAATLRSTNHAQAAIGAFSLGLYRTWRQAGFTPDVVAGHSLGELTALCAAGVITEADYLALLHARGHAMAQPPAPGLDAGAMLAVNGEVAALEAFIAEHDDVCVANRNSRTQLVVAGSLEALETLKAELEGLGNAATLLPVSAAFHSRRVAHARDPFAQALREVTFAPPRTPVYSNATAEPYPEAPAAARALLADHLVSPVNFQQDIEAIYGRGGDIFVEFGPRGVLTGLVRNILGDRPHLAVALNPGRSEDSDLQLRRAHMELRVAGVPVDAIDPDQPLPAVTAVRPGLTTFLNGAPYVSDRTRARIASALAPGATVAAATPARGSLNHNEERLEQSMASDENRSSAHRQYLVNMSDYSDKYFKLTQQLYSLISGASLPPGALERFERGMALFHDQQMQAQRVHERYLGHEDAAGVVSAPSAPAPRVIPPLPLEAPAPAPARVEAPVDLQQVFRDTPPAQAGPRGPVAVAERPAAAAPASGADEIAAILLAVISEKTGYPPDTLDVMMDLDADLGIDSIKRVEIMAALEGQLIGSLANLDFEQFGELRTISQIANYLATPEKKTLVS